MCAEGACLQCSARFKLAPLSPKSFAAAFCQMVQLLGRTIWGRGEPGVSAGNGDTDASLNGIGVKRPLNSPPKSLTALPLTQSFAARSRVMDSARRE